MESIAEFSYIHHHLPDTLWASLAYLVLLEFELEVPLGGFVDHLLQDLIIMFSV